MAQAAPEELRPAADAAPEEVPFQTAAATPADLAAGQVAVEPEPAKAEVAANVPIPSWRPDEPAVAQTASVAPAASMPLTEEDQSLLMAMASPDPLPSAAATNAVAVPTARPTADDEAFPVSALPETAPAPSMPPPEMGAEQKAAVEAEIKANGERVVALASAEAASPKLALASSAPGADPATVISGGVKTTRSRAAPRPPQASASRAPSCWRRAGSGSLGADQGLCDEGHAGDQGAVLRLQYRGFGAARSLHGWLPEGRQIGDANRFTGKAVKFLTVARFQ